MPAGHTHDRVTLWSLPVVAAVTYERTRNSQFTLLVAGGFLFSGLMFGPDLDIHSRQYKRWGPLRWLWLPYRKQLRHRSLLSHGPIIGTVGRIVYLLAWVAFLGTVIYAFVALGMQALGYLELWRSQVQPWVEWAGEWVGRSIVEHPWEWVAIVVGMELGSLSHSVSDWLGSGVRRWRKGKREKSVPVMPPPEPEIPVVHPEVLTPEGEVVKSKGFWRSRRS